MIVKKLQIVFLCFLSVGILMASRFAFCESEYTVFDDRALINGYAQKYAEQPKEILIEMIKDNELTTYMSSAAVRVFREKFSKEIVGAEKIFVEKILLYRLNRSNSNFIDIEIMHTLCVMDRYRYFTSMAPDLIGLLDHYNETVNEIAYAGLTDIVINGPKRQRDARIVFETVRKILFLSRKKLENVKTPSLRLKQKIELVRWAIKILGTQELQRLPSSIIKFL